MDVDQDRFAALITWAMCRMAGGAGIGKCDPERCVCGAEGKTVAAELYGNGYVLTERGEGTKMVGGVSFLEPGEMSQGLARRASDPWK